MKLSIITPTYNVAACIRICLESVASQQSVEIEHIIQDGGSTDASVEIVREFASAHPHVKWCSEPDKGIYDAMNRGLAKASGDYVCFLGADDRFESPQTLQTFLRAAGNSSADLLYGDVITVGAGLQGLPDGARFGGQFESARLFRENICHQAIFYSRAFTERVGPYSTRYWLYGDWEYNLRCFAQGRPQYVPVVVARYNTKGRSHTELDINFCAEFFDLIRKYYGVSIFDRRMRGSSHWLRLSGRIRLRQRRDWRGLLLLVAAWWHSARSRSRP
jgi:glycosyltransferase involved in cell wall biosynthesis